MAYQITAPSQVNTSLLLPSSKSISNRVLIINQLTGKSYRPMNLAECEDTTVMVNGLNTSEEVIDIRAAGTAMRFLTAYFAVTPGCRTLTGTARMQKRPIRVLVDALRHLGAEIEYLGEEGFPPLRIVGKPLEGGELTVDGGVSSQFVSALLMIAPMLDKGLKLNLQGVTVSRPYIDLTLQLMRHFGAQAEWLSDLEIQVMPGGYRSVPIVVEADWTAASYWYEVVALAEGGEVELAGLRSPSMQGDSSVKDLFELLGVETIFTDRGVLLRKQPIAVKRLNHDFVNQPDLAPTFVMTCALLGIPFHFTGLQSLRIKETDRVKALVLELAKLGYDLQQDSASELSWDGTRRPLTDVPTIDTYEDHRMAMAFAPVACRVPGLMVNNPQVVSKSYPDFWEDMRNAGFRMKEVSSEE